ncbi:S41 family peptidase [Candidatus Woesebacteria bacterium]|nr:S41 family peptidase [Candidatus Woesebacteria bacterium]
MQKFSMLPKVNFLKARILLVGLLFILGVFFAGYYIGSSHVGFIKTSRGTVTISRVLPDDKSSVDFALFWKVWDTVSSKYVDKSKINQAEMVYGAIQGMVSAIGDPYTVFLSPKQNKVVDEDLSGSFEGIGIQIGFKGTQLSVMSPLPGSPAEKAGIKAGDFIVHIKDDRKKIDINTVGMSLPEAVQDIRGTAGTKVTLTLIRSGVDKPIVVDVVREKLDVPSVTYERVGDGKSIGLIKISKFAQETQGEWNKAVSEIYQDNNIKAVIIDLRNNPGGYLQEAVDIASDFVKTGSVVTIEEDANGSRQNFKSERVGKLIGKPVVILINGGSASASEILAGALRDDRGIKLIGETSFGKGTIQEPLELDNGAGLHITTAKWLTPNGTWVNGKGLDPDVKVTDDEKTSVDEQLKKAIEVLNIH